MSKLSNKEHELLVFLEQEYLLNGTLPTCDMAVDRQVTTKADFNAAFRNVDFRHALVARGINLAGLDPKAPIAVLSEHQLVVANAMLDLRDNRSQKKKLTELNCSSAKWESWLRDPVFNSYLRQRAENLLGDNLHESHLALLDRVRSGDVNAIKYFNEITGRYVPAASSTVDINGVLMRVLEIIQKHVTQPEIAGAIADDLLALTTVSPNVPSPRPIRVIEAFPAGASDI